MQERQLKAPEQTIAGETTFDRVERSQKKNTIDTTIRQQISTSVNQSTNSSVSQSNDGNVLSPLFSIFPSVGDIGYNPNSEDEQQLKPKKKKKRRPRIS
ncbi:hypothetical protein FACS1894174_07280 [Bacteroidia bacterium]|nr:hypothetical protein FACS1894155_08330 [Bacteroidia bacterium]GHV22533.1 hypothetical protein FACS1894174_07280 [Bacteroidia bacterium]